MSKFRTLPAQTRFLSPSATRPLLASILLAATAAACAAQPRTSAVEQLRAAEDARATGAALAPVFAALRPDAEPALLRLAIRAMGRLQRPALLDSLTPFLSHVGLGLRLEAANAIAQVVQPGTDTAAVAKSRAALLARLPSATRPEEAGVIARSLGRLPHESQAIAEQVAERIAASLSPAGGSVRACPGDVRQGLTATLDSLNQSLIFGTLHGIYAIARRIRGLGCKAHALALAALNYRVAVSADTAVWVRELAMFALLASNRADGAVLRQAARDSDPRVRRLAMRVTRDTTADLGRLVAGQQDPAAMVRIDAVRALAATRKRSACAAATRALSDHDAHVRGEAIDAVAATCDPARATPLLDSLARRLASDTANAGVTWHAPARALVALARIAPNVAMQHFARFRTHPVWQVRAQLAAASRAVSDTAVLLGLLRDGDANVRETAIGLLAEIGPGLAERAVRAGLDDDAYQVVLGAAQAAERVPTIPVAALAAPLERLTARRQETSRDPRIELIERIAQRGTPRDSAVLRPYLADFDTLIARRASELLSRWTGRNVAASPRRIAQAESLADTEELYLRVTLSPASGGGSFVVRLDPIHARATVARVLRLARQGYYNGRTFHRVVPNFVIQGGSPDANEYVGDGPYMRDELWLKSHTRGTLGISTRGRDTGDAQIFVNLVDNFRLDHDYTVFGEIVEGMEVVDRIQAGAVMQAVEAFERSR